MTIPEGLTERTCVRCGCSDRDPCVVGGAFLAAPGADLDPAGMGVLQLTVTCSWLAGLREVLLDHREQPKVLERDEGICSLCATATDRRVDRLARLAGMQDQLVVG